MRDGAEYTYLWGEYIRHDGANMMIIHNMLYALFEKIFIYFTFNIGTSIISIFLNM